MNDNINLRYTKGYSIHSRSLGSKVREDVKGGVSVYVDGKHGKINYVEVAANPRWSQKTHLRFPLEFKKAVMSLLLAKKRHDCLIHLLPEGVFFHIVRDLSRFYEASTPLDLLDYPLPLPKKDTKS